MLSFAISTLWMLCSGRLVPRAWPKKKMHDVEHDQFASPRPNCGCVEVQVGSSDIDAPACQNGAGWGT